MALCCGVLRQRQGKQARGTCGNAPASALSNRGCGRCSGGGPPLCVALRLVCFQEETRQLGCRAVGGEPSCLASLLQASVRRCHGDRWTWKRLLGQRRAAAVARQNRAKRLYLQFRNLRKTRNIGQYNSSHAFHHRHNVFAKRARPRSCRGMGLPRGIGSRCV